MSSSTAAPSAAAPAAASSSTAAPMDLNVVPQDMNFVFSDEIISAIDEVVYGVQADDEFHDPSSWEARRHAARLKHVQKLRNWVAFEPTPVASIKLKPLSGRWVDNETFLEVKSRWVSRGFEQEEADIIFYAATPFPAELKILLVLALIFDWEVIIADAESAFL